MDDFLQQREIDNALYLSDIEYHTSVKPAAIEYLLERFSGFIVYCDSDLFFISELCSERVFKNGSDVVLTPHNHTYQDDCSDLSMARSGVFNAGFVGVTAGGGLDFVKWWRKKTQLYCLLEPEEGLFVDQKWLDLAPALFESVHILRDPKYNLAYWNFDQRTLNSDTVFIHLSGIDLSTRPELGGVLSKHSSLKIDSRLLHYLSEYYETYGKIKASIDCAVEYDYLTSYGKIISKKKAIVEKRYFAKRFYIELINGTPVLRNRIKDDFLSGCMCRSQFKAMFFTRYLGRILIVIGFGRVVEFILRANKVLSRRSNWIK